MLQYGKYKIMLIRKTSKVGAESQESTLVTYKVFMPIYKVILTLFKEKLVKNYKLKYFHDL